MKKIKVRSARVISLSLLLGLSLVGLSLLLARPPAVTAAAVPVTNTDDSGMGSLRAAISSAMPGDMIVFNLPAGSTTITLTSGELLIDKNLTISGPGASFLTVQRSTAGGTPNFRIFDIASGSFNVTISGLTISNGSEGNGGGGGILTQIGSTLTVTGCAISGNANISGAGAFGGGIDNEGTVNVINSTISGNSAGNGGGILHHSASTLNITGCTLSTNSVTNGGGGIDISELPGTVNVTNSTLAGNTGAGGGIGNFARGTVNVTNCTISGNSDSGSIGGTGGILNFFNGTMNVTNCTISGNSSTRGNTGGIENSSGGTMNVKNTIIAQNTSRVGFPDVSGVLTSQGYNLIGNNSGATITPTTGDQIGTSASPIDPKLGPLQDNGGPTFTKALLTGSPAIDKGSAATDPVSGNPITTDQRGLPRPVDDPAIPNATGGDGSDIGAFEEQMPTGVACTLVCPANITQPNDPNQCGAVVNYPALTTSGSCGTITCSPLSGSFFPKGTTTVTCSEPGGASCSFTVTVNDTQNPSVTCPNNITFTTPGNNDPCGVVTYTTPTGSDNCAVQSVVCNPPSGTCFLVGVTTVTCTATDTSNNTGQCTFKVTVQNPVQNPCTIACPANQTASTGPGATQCGAVVNYPAPATTGAGCGTVTCNPPSGSFFPVGMTTVTCTTTAGPSCTFKVTVTDNTPPVFSSGCAAGITLAAQASCPFATSTLVNFATPTANDNCSTLTVVCNPPAGSMFPVGTTTVTCTATDGAGNTAQCTFPVNVFSFCLQDDSIPGNVVFVNAITGDYLFCSSGVAMASGRGMPTVRGCSFDIDSTKGDRKVHIQGDTSANNGAGAGTAYIQKTNGHVVIQITDRNMSNNTCSCSPSQPPGSPRDPDPVKRTNGN